MIPRNIIEPALPAAVKDRQYHVVKSYLDKGAAATACIDGNNSLHLAVLNNDVDMLILLLRYNLDITCLSHMNASRYTPIVLAAVLEYWQCVLVIAMSRADLYDQPRRSFEYDGKYNYGTALLSAARNNKLLHTSTLINAKASTHEWIYTADNRDTALHCAVKNANPWMVALLVLANAKLDSRNSEYQTPVTLAAALKHWDCAMALVEPERFTLGLARLSMVIILEKYRMNDSPLSWLPRDVLLQILKLSFGKLSEIEPQVIKNASLYINARDNKYLSSVSIFTSKHAQYGRLKKAVNIQSDASAKFVESLQRILNSDLAIDKKTITVRHAIGLFAQQKGQQKSRAIELLGSYNLLPKL